MAQAIPSQIFQHPTGENQSQDEIDRESSVETEQKSEKVPEFDGLTRRLELRSTNALTNFDQVVASVSDNQLVLFLDYDGTLAPIVNNPEEAFMSEEMREVVRQLSEKYTTAIVSGRGLDRLTSFISLPLSPLYFAGSHGFDIIGPNLRHRVAEDVLPILQRIAQEVEEQLHTIDGATVENNLFSVTIHYRNVESEEEVNEIKRIVDGILESAGSQLKLTYGKKVLELRPNFLWHKGKAVMHLLETLGLLSKNEVTVLFLGDDLTDEDAFKDLREESKECTLFQGKGYGIVVSDDSSGFKNSAAMWSLRDTTQVKEFLGKLADL